MPSLHALLRRRHGHGATTADASARAVALASCLATAALLLTMAAPLLAGRVYVNNDLGAFHLPIRAFYAERLDRGEPFDWMPQLFAGFYLTGEGQGGTYHPLHWLLYRFLPLPADSVRSFLNGDIALTAKVTTGGLSGFTSSPMTLRL